MERPPKTLAVLIVDLGDVAVRSTKDVNILLTALFDAGVEYAYNNPDEIVLPTYQIST